MKKFCAASAFIFCCLIKLTAQITLTQSSYPTDLLGLDSLKHTVYNSSFPSFAPMANGVWDLSTVTDSTTNIILSHKPAVSGYQFADSNYYATAGLLYLGYLQSSITSSGMQQFGISVPHQTFCLLPQTGSSTDTLYIDSQYVSFSMPVSKLSFPSSFNSTWISSSVSDLHIHVRFISATMIYTAAIHRQYLVEYDSVVGYGKMRVTDATGNPSQYFDVLQVQSLICTFDSVLSDTLTNQSLITPILHLNEGQRDTSYQQFFYRQGSVTPLAQISFQDKTFTNPTKAITHMQENMNLVPNLKALGNIVVYPNPVIDRQININLPQEGRWHIQLADKNGRTVLDTDTGTNVVELNLPKNLPVGTYTLKCGREKGGVFYETVDIVE